MPSELRPVLPHLLAMFAGGLLSSFALARLARTRRGRSILERLGGVGMTVSSLVALIAGVGAAYWMVRVMLAGPAGGEGGLPHPAAFLGFGLLLGLPLGLPGIVVVWSEIRPKKREARRKKGAVATKDDRREYVDTLVEQILEASPRDRSLKASIAGEGGRVLRFVGELSREEGERLTEALRRDLEEVGFKRVEGETPGGGTWWTRV